jgi:hypothetical protein
MTPLVLTEHLVKNWLARLTPKHYEVKEVDSYCNESRKTEAGKLFINVKKGKGKKP